MLIGVSRLTLFLFFSSFFAFSSALSAPSNSLGLAGLWSTYQQLENKLHNNDFNAPVYLTSQHDNEAAQGHVFAMLDHSFDVLTKRLTTASDWCEIIFLHVNVKGCASQSTDLSTGQINLFVGRKHYQRPEQAFNLRYDYRLQRIDSDYLHVELSASEGPLGTNDYLISVEVMRLDEQRSFLHFTYSYQFSFTARLAMQTYLSTLARDKVGFTRLINQSHEEPVYVKGIQGAIERNAMRYFLAIQAYLNSFAWPAEVRLEKRLSVWFDLTSSYQRQLYEVSRKEYLQAKRREYQNQLVMRGQ